MDPNILSYALIAACVGAFVVRVVTRDRPPYRTLSRLSVLLIGVVFVGLVGYLGIVFASGYYGGID